MQYYHENKHQLSQQVRKRRTHQRQTEEAAIPPYDEEEELRTRIPTRRSRNAETDEYRAGSFTTAITKRYDGIPVPDGILYRKGNEQIYVHNSPPPQQAVPQREAPHSAQKPRRLQWHWLLFVGIAFLVMVVGYAGFNAFGAWWQVRGDDGTYGRPRTYQSDAVVGHSDSESHPSHFIALNLNRHILIIEIPGGDEALSVIYNGPTLLGTGQDLTPVTLTFSDVNGDGRVDMLIHILDQTMIFLNNGTKFVPPSNSTVRGSNPPNLGE